MKEKIIQLREKIFGNEIPGEKLHKRVKHLAMMGSFDASDGSYEAGYSVSPTMDIVTSFKLSDETCALLIFDRGQNYLNVEFTIASYYEVFSDGSVLNLGTEDLEEAEKLVEKLNTNPQEAEDEIVEVLKRENASKRIMGVSDRLDDVQIGELQSLVKSKSLRGVYR